MPYIPRVPLDKLDPQFYDDVTKLLEKSPYWWYILSAYRSQAEQSQLYRDYLLTGKNKAAPPGQSAHNYGLAIDVVLDDSEAKGLQPTWNIKKAGWLWLFAKCKLHPRLKSGISFGDGAHIERYKWRRYINNITYDPITI